MVFENLTLVELHLENSPFDAGSPGESSERSAEEGSEPTGDEEGGRSMRGPVFLLVLVAAGAALAIRRRRSRSGEEQAAGEQISIEQAAEQ